MKKVFHIWRFVIGVAVAKSGTWGITTDKESRTFFLSLHTINWGSCSAFSVIVGPLALNVGYVG